MTEWKTVRQSAPYALATMGQVNEQHPDGDLLLHAYINGIFPTLKMHRSRVAQLSASMR